MSSINLLTGKIEYLEKEANGLLSALNTREEKLGRLRKAAAIEADVARKFQLEQEIKAEEEELERDQAKLDQLGEKIEQTKKELDQAQAVAGPAPQQGAAQAVALDWASLYKVLLRLDFIDQVNQFQGYIETQRVGAFLIHGIPDGAQLWLLNRLRHYIPNSINAHVFRIDLARLSRSKKIETLWSELYQRTNMLDSRQPAEVALKISALWQNQTVILIFDNLDLITKEYTCRLIQDFWLPLVNSACAAPPPYDCRLLMFLIDNRGSTGKWDVGFVETADPPVQPQTPMKLPKITRLSEEILKHWIINAHDELPRELTARPEQATRAILKQSDNGVPLSVLEHICLKCGYSLYQGESQWKVL